MSRVQRWSETVLIRLLTHCRWKQRIPPKCRWLYQSIRCNIPEDLYLHRHGSENLKCNDSYSVSSKNTRVSRKKWEGKHNTILSQATDAFLRDLVKLRYKIGSDWKNSGRSLTLHLHTGHWNHVIVNTCMRKFALYKHRSPVHQSHYSQFELTNTPNSRTECIKGDKQRNRLNWNTAPR